MKLIIKARHLIGCICFCVLDCSDSSPSRAFGDSSVLARRCRLRAACAEAVTSRFRAVGSDSCGGSAAAACVRSKAYAGWKALSAVRLEFAVESWTLERRAERVSSRY